MSVKPPKPVSIGDRKTEFFLLRLSKQSQESIKLLEARGALDSQPSLDKSQRPLYTNINRFSDSKIRSSYENKSDFSNGHLKSSFDGDKDTSRFPLSSNDKKTPKLPAKPQKLSESSLRIFEKNPPPRPPRPTKIQASSTLSLEQQRANIQIELPNYVARPRSPEPPVLPSRNRIHTLEVTKRASPPPKPAKLLVNRGVRDVGTESENTFVIEDGRRHLPRPTKPAGLKNSRGIDVALVTTFHDGIAQFRSENNVLIDLELTSLTPNSSVPSLNSLKTPLNRHNYSSSSTKPTISPGLTLTSSPPMKPVKKPLILKKLTSNTNNFQSPTKIQSLSDTSNTVQQTIKVLKPIAPVKKAMPCLPPKIEPAVTSRIIEIHAMPDFRATLSSVIRAQTDPDVSTKTTQSTITRARTAPGPAQDSSKLEKLTHPNKARSKGPKRRLPKDSQTQTSSSAAANAANLEKEPFSKPSDGFQIENLHKSSDIAPLRPVQRAQTDILQPTKQRQAPPPKGPKPDFKALGSSISVPKNWINYSKLYKYPNYILCFRPWMLVLSAVPLYFPPPFASKQWTSNHS